MKETFKTFIPIFIVFEKLVKHVKRIGHSHLLSEGEATYLAVLLFTAIFESKLHLGCMKQVKDQLQQISSRTINIWVSWKMSAGWDMDKISTAQSLAVLVGNLRDSEIHTECESTAEEYRWFYVYGVGKGFL